VIAASKIKAFGPWVLVKVDPHPEKFGEHIYMPQGNLEERIGGRTGVVISVGQGYFNRCKNGKSPKTKFNPLGIKIGERVRFRGMLHDVGKYHQGIEGIEHSMVHADDIEGVIEE